MNGYCTPDPDLITNLNFYELAIQLRDAQIEMSDLKFKINKIQKAMETQVQNSRDMFKGISKAIIYNKNSNYTPVFVERHSASQFTVIGYPQIDVLKF